jgi:ssDNA-binding Zn-finger/Zn-ribbon topoisomerase 1
MRVETIGATLVAECPDCGGQLRVRTRRSDGEPFLSCSRFPRCRCAMSYVEGLAEVHAELSALRLEVRSLKAREVVPAPPGGEEAIRTLRDLLVRFHPDKRGATVATLEVAQAVGEAFNRLRRAGPS